MNIELLHVFWCTGVFLCGLCSSPSADWGLVSASLLSYHPEKHTNNKKTLQGYFILTLSIFQEQFLNFSTDTKHSSSSFSTTSSLTDSRRLSMNISRVWTQSMLTPCNCSELGSRGTVSSTSRHWRGSADNRLTVWLWYWEKITGTESERRQKCYTQTYSKW